MRSNDIAVLESVQRKQIAMNGDALRKLLADDLKRAIGKAIERGIVLAQMTRQEVAFEMGYEDASALSRWIAGAETPQFARLFMVMKLRAPLVVALAELSEDAVVTTSISIRRSA